MSMQPTLNDALGLIQRAEASIASNKDDGSYCEKLQELVSGFKTQLSQDHNLPVEFFEPVDLDLEQEESASDEAPQPERIELTPEAKRLYDDIETSI